MLFGKPSWENFLWLIAVGFSLGLGWATAAWLIGRTLGRLV
jgi:hypothetical protein